MTSPEVSPAACRMLWLAVLERAIADARGRVEMCGRSGGKLSEDRAETWLLRDVRDFYTVCELADVDPAAVRRRAREVLAESGRAA